MLSWPAGNLSSPRGVRLVRDGGSSLYVLSDNKGLYRRSSLGIYPAPGSCWEWHLESASYSICASVHVTFLPLLCPECFNAMVPVTSRGEEYALGRVLGEPAFRCCCCCCLGCTATVRVKSWWSDLRVRPQGIYSGVIVFSST